MRVLFVLLRPKYVPPYEAPLRVLAERGHEIHLTFSVERSRGSRQTFDLGPVEQLAADHPGRITWDEGAPRRDPADGWCGIAWTIRMLGDFFRYLHPRYADAPLLQGRLTDRLVRSARSRLPAPLAGMVERAIGVLLRHPCAALSDWLLGLCRDLERAIPSSRRIEEYIRGHAPDVVLVTPLVDVASDQAEYLKSATVLRIPAGLCVASWDNLTNKGVIRNDPDAVFVWNEAQRVEAAELHGVPPERVVATGAPKFDKWFSRTPTLSPGRFAEKVGLDAELPYLLYVCSSYFIAPNEVDFVRGWLHALRSSTAEGLRSVGVLVRPHPDNAASWRAADLSTFGNVTVYPREGAYVDDDVSRADFFDSIYHSSGVVGINTSAMIEAAIVGKRVYTILSDEFAGSQEGTLHFRYLRRENGGPVLEARGLEEHVRQLEEDVRGAGRPEREPSAFVQEFIRPHGLDRAAAPILADAVERLAASPAHPPVRTLRTRALQRMLAAVAAVQRRTARQEVGPLQRADGEIAGQVELELRALRRKSGPIAVGPWFGDLAEEALYWIPFARKRAAALGLGPSRLVAVSHGGMASWYEDFCGEYVELHDLLDDASLERVFVGWASERRRAIERALAGLGIPADRSLPAAAMRRLLHGYRAGRSPLAFALEHLEFVGRGTREEDVSSLVAVDASLLGRTRASAPLLSLATRLAAAGRLSLVGDLPEDFAPALARCATAPSADLPPRRRRGETAGAVARARLLIGAPDGTAPLGPLLGVPTVALRAADGAVSDPDLVLAGWVARHLGSAFSVVDAGRLDLVCAIAGLATEGLEAAAAGSSASPAAGNS